MINYHIVILRLIAGFIMFALFLAYFLADSFGVQGCTLCQYQRFLYIAILVCAGIGLGFITLADFMLVLISIMFLSVATLSGYQILLENGLIEPLIKCNTVDFSKVLDVSSLQSSLEHLNADTSCGEPFYVFYYVTLAGFSFIFSIGMFIFVTLFATTAILFKYDQTKFSKKITG